MRDHRIGHRRVAGLMIAATVALSLFLPGSGAAADETTPSVAPKLLLTPDVIARIHKEAKSKDFVARNLQLLLKAADKHLAERTLVEKFKKDYGGKPSYLPHIGHKSVPRLTDLALAWRVTGEDRYAARAREELLGLAKLETWFPAHFLGLSRMALGVTLGYDWLAGYLSTAERELVRSALIDKALKPGLEIYKGDNRRYRDSWVNPGRRNDPQQQAASLPGVPAGTGAADLAWPVSTFNWNIACNTGLILAALAVRPEASDVAETVFDRAMLSVRSGFDEFAPDGVWPEGPMYWALAARDAAILIGSLETAKGQSFGLSKSLGLSETGHYILQVTGPTGLTFNYGDSDTQVDPTAMGWLGARYEWSVYAWFAEKFSGNSLIAFDLLWQRSKGLDPVQALEPPVGWFAGYNLVTMRSDWLDPAALYLGMKAGDSRSHHDDLDLGTFVLEGRSVRWAVALGAGNYDLPGYFDKGRFQYYRTATIGQNTLTFDGQNQRDFARSDIIAFGNSPRLTFAIADLSDAYDAPKKTVLRGVAMIDGSYAVIHDEISEERPERALWTMHTRASITLDGGKALLEQDGEQLAATILTPTDARFEIRSANPCETAFNTACEQQNPNEGVKRLVISLPPADQGETRRIAVLLAPGTSVHPDPLPPVIWLSRWRQGLTFGVPPLNLKKD